MTDLKNLRHEVENYTQPESEQILANKIDEERRYIQEQLIVMEVKQIAESITRVTHAKRILAQTEVDSKAESIGLCNRPLLLQRQLTEQMAQHAKT